MDSWDPFGDIIIICAAAGCWLRLDSRLRSPCDGLPQVSLLSLDSVINCRWRYLFSDVTRDAKRVFGSFVSMDSDHDGKVKLEWWS